jgi:xylan 1,4-beta-xylosidase
VEALAARHDDGCIGILVWNATLDQSKIAGDAELDRRVRVRVEVPPGRPYTVRHYRVDAEHSNIAAAWAWMRDGAAWPDEGQWRTLRALNTLDELCAQERVSARAGPEFTFDLPMPGVSYLELVP